MGSLSLMGLYRAEVPTRRASQFTNATPLRLQSYRGSPCLASSFSEQKVTGVEMAAAGLSTAKHLAACRAIPRGGWFRQDDLSRNSIRRWSRLATRGHPHGLPGLGKVGSERFEAEEAEQEGDEEEEGIEVIEIVNGYPAASAPHTRGNGSGGGDGLARIRQAGSQQVRVAEGQAEVTASYGIGGRGVQEREVGKAGVAMAVNKRPPPVKVKYTMLGARSKPGRGEGGGFPATVQGGVWEDTRTRAVHGHSHGSGHSHNHNSQSSHSHRHGHDHHDHESDSDGHDHSKHHHHHGHSHHNHHHGSHSHSHGHDHHHHHHHHHHHDGSEGNFPQRAIQWVADRTFISPLADLLRENALAAGVSLALCVLASIVPLLPPPLFHAPVTQAAVQNGLVLGALSLTAVSE